MLLKRPLCCLLMATTTFIACQKDNVQQPKDLELTTTEQERVNSGNLFAFKMLKELAVDAGPAKNTVFSPLSISTAVAMVSNGANDATLDGIRTALEFNGATEEEINS